MSVDVEVLNGDLGIIAHQLPTVGAGWWAWAAGEKQQPSFIFILDRDSWLKKHWAPPPAFNAAAYNENTF